MLPGVWGVAGEAGKNIRWKWGPYKNSTRDFKTLLIRGKKSLIHSDWHIPSWIRFSWRGKISRSYTINLRRHPASTIIVNSRREMAFLLSRTEFKADLHPPPQSSIFTRTPIMYWWRFNFALWKLWLAFYFGTPSCRTCFSIRTATLWITLYLLQREGW